MPVLLAPGCVLLFSAMAAVGDFFYSIYLLISHYSTCLVPAEQS